MNLVTPKAKQATQLIMACIIAALCLWAVYGIVQVFSPKESGEHRVTSPSEQPDAPALISTKEPTP